MLPLKCIKTNLKRTPENYTKVIYKYLDVKNIRVALKILEGGRKLNETFPCCSH